MAKLHLPKITSEADGILDEKFFEIGNPALIMEILRNKLYADPVTAVVREYSCNAMDSHAEANKPDEPILINLPSEKYPELKIQDFGVGISPDRMNDIYIKMGNSTKRDTNDQIGCWGLGSKSAWSYTDTFSIVTTFSNIKRAYVAYLDDSRTGKLVLQSEEVCFEPNQTSIIIPVKAKDFSAFENALTKITQYWKVKPKVFRNKSSYELDYIREKIILEGTNWSIVEKAGYSYYGSESKAIIGGIGYTIPSDPFTKLSAKVKDFIFSNNFRFYFQNGDLSLSAGRDSLHTDPRTIKKLTEQFDLVIQEYSNRIEETVKSASSYREAYQLLAKMDRNINYAYIDFTKLKWNNIQLYKELSLRMPLFDGILGVRYSRVYSRKKGDYSEIVGKNLLDSNYRAKSFDYLLHPEKINYKYIFNDSKVKNVKPYAESVFDQDTETVFVLSLENEDEALTSEQQELIDALTQKISTINLVQVVKPKIARKVAKKDFVLAYPHFDSKTTVEIDPKEGGVYYIKDNDQISDLSGNSFRIASWQLTDTSKFIGKKIYGFTRKRAENLPNNWVSFYDAIKESCATFESKYGLQHIYECSVAEDHGLKPYYFKYIEGLKQILPSTDSIIELYNLWLEIETIDKDTKMYRSMVAVYKLHPQYHNLYENSPNWNNVNALYLKCDGLDKAIEQRYTLLPYLSSSSIPEKEFLDYIKLVNK